MDLYCENTDLQLNRKFLRAVSNGGQGTLQTASSSLEVPGGDSSDKTQSQGSHANAERKGRGSKQVGAVTDALISRHTPASGELGWDGGGSPLPLHLKGILSLLWLTHRVLSSDPVFAFSTSFSRDHSRFSHSIKRLTSKYVLRSSHFYESSLGGEGVSLALYKREAERQGTPRALLKAHS